MLCEGLAWWPSGKESTVQCRGSILIQETKIPHATGQLGPCATIHSMHGPMHHKEGPEQPPKHVLRKWLWQKGQRWRGTDSSCCLAWSSECDCLTQGCHPRFCRFCIAQPLGVLWMGAIHSVNIIIFYVYYSSFSTDRGRCFLFGETKVQNSNFPKDGCVLRKGCLSKICMKAIDTWSLG